MKKILRIILCSLFCTLLIYTECMAGSERRYSFQLDQRISDRTTEFTVVYDNSGCVINPEYENAALYITANGKTIFKRNCTVKGNTVGHMHVKIPKQKAGVKLKFFLKKAGWKSNVRQVTVRNSRSFYPKYKTGRINNPTLVKKNYSTYIKAQKGQRIVISNGTKVVKTVLVRKSNYLLDTMELEKYLEKSELYVFSSAGGIYSKNYLVLPKQISINE